MLTDSAQTDPKVAADYRLALPKQPNTRSEYRLEVQTDAVLGNWASENRVITHLRKSFQHHTASGQLYAVELLHFEQVNGLGMNQLVADLMPLKNRLLLEITATGQIDRVANRAEIEHQFEALKPLLLKKYRSSEVITPPMLHAVSTMLADDAHLVRVLAESPEYALLFPDLFNRPYTADRTAHVSRTIPRIFGNVDLPLLTQACHIPAPAGATYAVLVEGRPDPASYDAAAVHQAVRALTGQHDAAADLRATHLESYELDARGEVQCAARLTTAAIPGVFSSKTVATLRELLPVTATLLSA